ncbi:MAG: ABC transporter ATP-binding protein [Sulfurospirillum sp.]|nr:MAG: ABC transporter ATP-binding protein [Sulfurospirillum sp.]
MQRYTFSDIFSEIKKYKKELVLANIVALLAALAVSPAPLLMPLLVDEVLLHKPGYLTQKIDMLFGASDHAWFYVLVVLLFTLLLRTLYFVLSVIQSWYFTVISKNITYKIRRDLLDQIARVHLREFENFGGGKIASLAVVDVNTIDTFLSSSISKLVISLFMIIGVSVVLLLIHWKLALFILFFNPFVIILTRKIAKKVSKYKKEENAIIATFQESLSETMELFRQVRAANAEGYFFGNLKKLAEEIREKGIAFAYKSQISQNGSYMIFLAGFEIFRAAGILMVAYSDLSIGLMLAIFGYLWVIVAPINQVISIQYAYHNAKEALDRINAIFALEQEPRYPHNKNPFAQKRTNSVTVKNVSFAYQKELPVLRDVSLEIPEGKKVALVGASGNGKTTLAQLIVGFYQPDSGDILYDGISFREIGLDVIRAHVYLVLQSPMLFNETIRFNLTFGKDVPDEKIYEALEIAQLSDFLKQLPEGLDTLVGTNGVKLSGGQRQRISIARMIISDPNIVIFDESTSALDVRTEEVLFKNLESFLAKRTTIIIAHRLSTIKRADYIYVLDEGKVAEEGRLEEMLRRENRLHTFFNP